VIMLNMEHSFTGVHANRADHTLQHKFHGEQLTET
jgi:hypothetical protein